jgi:hypothetical protein
MLLEIIPSAENVLQKNHVRGSACAEFGKHIGFFWFFKKSIALFDLLADDKDRSYIFHQKSIYIYDGCISACAQVMQVIST